MTNAFWLLPALFAVQASWAQPVSNRTALIIGVGQYGVAGADPLVGVKYDMISATKIANAMGIDTKNIKYLQNSEATKDNIIKALNALGGTSSEGSKAFVYFSGHGTRQQSDDGCVEALLTYEGKTITNQEFAKATQKLVKSADKVVTMIDACHAGGVTPPVNQTRSMGALSLTPKFYVKSGGQANNCAVVSNLKTRSLVPEVTRLGGLKENFVQITAARPEEQALDQPGLGGIATQALRDCLLGTARDLNSSGAVSMSEIEQCAQHKINNSLRGNPDYAPHHVTVSGNRNLIPVQRPPTVVAAVTPEPSGPVTPTPPVVIPPAVPTPAPPVVVTQEPVKPEPIKPAESVLASLETLKDIEQQRNPRRVVDVKLSKPVMKIGKDSLDLSIKSSHDGYIYMILLGSDAKSFYVLYPNGLDKNNTIKAGQTVRIPRPDWEVKAVGPAGTNNLLVLVSDTPRKINTLTMSEPTAAEPFTYALNDIGGRSALISFLTTSDGRSESFGAKLVAIKEVK